MLNIIKSIENITIQNSDIINNTHQTNGIRIYEIVDTFAMNLHGYAHYNQLVLSLTPNKIYQKQINQYLLILCSKICLAVFNDLTVDVNSKNNRMASAWHYMFRSYFDYVN